MVQLLCDWHLAVIFSAALLSPGWGALCAGIFAGLGAGDFVTAVAAAAAGGFSRDALLYLLAARGADLPCRIPAVVVAHLRARPVPVAIGLQSVHLFRWDMAAAAGAGRQPAGRFLAGLLAASALCAAAGAAASELILLRTHPGELGLFAARQTLPGLILLALLAAETLRITLERLTERIGIKHENPPR